MQYVLSPDQESNQRLTQEFWSDVRLVRVMWHLTSYGRFLSVRLYPYPSIAEFITRLRDNQITGKDDLETRNIYR